MTVYKVGQIQALRDLGLVKTALDFDGVPMTTQDKIVAASGAVPTYGVLGSAALSGAGAPSGRRASTAIHTGLGVGAGQATGGAAGLVLGRLVAGLGRKAGLGPLGAFGLSTASTLGGTMAGGAYGAMKGRRSAEPKLLGHAKKVTVPLGEALRG